MSKLEIKIIKNLEDLGYTGPLLKPTQFTTAIQEGQRCIEFTTLVSFLTNEIRTILNIDEEVNAINAPEEAVEFVMEITSFLKELNCPYKKLMHGTISDRMQTTADRLLLLDYLISELMGARILLNRRPDKKIEVKLRETPEAANLRQILQTLKFSKPPPNLTIKQLFDKLEVTVPIVLKKAGTDLMGNALFNGLLSDRQWETLNGVQSDLKREYRIRRDMLLTRLDVTIQSFQWSDRTKGKDDTFEQIYYSKRKTLKAEPNVELSDLIAARTELAIIEKTSNASVRKNTKSSVNKVIIGQVPDRGGRSWEQAPPPPEMPSWQQRSTGPAPASGDGGGRGGRGGGRGAGQSNDRGRQRGGSFSRGRSNDNYNVALQGRVGGSGSSQDYSGNRNYNNQDCSYGGGYDNYNRRDSYPESYSNDYQQNKRPKTYDSFQVNKTTYAEQHVQEMHYNQQQQSYQRGGRGGGYRNGRPNYRGGGNYY